MSEAARDRLLEDGVVESSPASEIWSAREWGKMLCRFRRDELIRHARRELREDAHLSEDLVGGVLLAIVEGEFEGRFKLPASEAQGIAFTLTLMRNRARNVRQSQRRFVSLPAAGIGPVADRSDPWRRAECAELRGAVVAALGRLSSRERQVVVFHWIEQWTTPEIAGELGIARKTVEEMLRRARKKPRVLLAPDRPIATGHPGPPARVGRGTGPVRDIYGRARKS